MEQLRLAIPSPEHKVRYEEMMDEGESVQVYHVDLAERKRYVKAIITDLDRTLLHTDKTISEYTLSVLKKCHEKGMLLLAATARPHRAILGYHEQVKFDAMTVMNGADVILPGKKLPGYEIARRSAEEILKRLCQLPDIILSVELGSDVYANVEIPEWEAKVHDDFPKLPTDGPIYKILVSRPKENIGPLVEPLLTEDTYCTVAGNNLVQVMNKKATKWNGIQMMLAETGILPEDAVYFGDDNDDIEALKNCGTGVAVENAIEAVKMAADVVTESNDEDGVAKWIERELVMSKAIFWDSDGTLMYGNESFLWSLDKALRDHGYQIEKSVIKEFLRSVCSWFMTEKPHPDAVGELWWAELLDHTKGFCHQHTVLEEEIRQICQEFRENVVLFDYQLYPDAEEILKYCTQLGYRNYLISNNFPELVKVFERLGLDKYFSGYFLSAEVGYEKPHAEIFRYALAKAGNPRVCYMVGDNPVADVKGAQTVAMKTILVHRKTEDIQPDYCCAELTEIKKIIVE